MRNDERKIATKLIDAALNSGREVAIFDEEGLVVKSNRRKPLLEQLGGTDVQQIIIYREEGYEEGLSHFGTVTLVYGNEPGVLMSDTSTGKEFLAFLGPIEEYQEKFAE